MSHEFLATRCTTCHYVKKEWVDSDYARMVRAGVPIGCCTHNGCYGNVVALTPASYAGHQAASKAIAYLVVMGAIFLLALILGALGAK